MEDEKDRPEASDSEEDVDTSAEGETDVDESDEGSDDTDLSREKEVSLASIAKSLGLSENASKEEILKKGKELNSFVGDQAIADVRKKAARAEELERAVEHIKKEAGWDDDTFKQVLKEAKYGDSPKEIYEIGRRVEWIELKSDNPELAPLKKDIVELADAKGISLAEAAELPLIKDAIAHKKSLKEKEKDKDVLESKGRIAGGNQAFRTLEKKVREKRSKNIPLEPEEEESLVREGLKHLDR